MRLRLCALGAICFSLVPLAATAQDAPSPLDRRDHSILLGIGETTNVGYWIRVGERTDVGIEGGFSFIEEDGSDVSTLSAILSLKRYWSPAESPVAPYTILGIRASWSDLLSTGNEEYGAFGGIGLDWFPVQRVSIGGHLGLRASLTQRTSPVFGGGEEEHDGWVVRTVSSGIRLQLYF